MILIDVPMTRMLLRLRMCWCWDVAGGAGDGSARDKGWWTGVLPLNRI